MASKKYRRVTVLVSLNLLTYNTVNIYCARKNVGWHSKWHR
nr:MAG TPA: hypothetical protein [Caudoviricetes sp.]